MFENKLKTKITLEDYPGLIFYPFHELVKCNGGEPYLKSIRIHLGLEITFFKVLGGIYALKPVKKNKHISKLLATKVENPLTLPSAEGSITGNCARGIKEEFVTYCNSLLLQNLSDEDLFIKIVKG
jgi:hypothetical protein